MLNIISQLCNQGSELGKMMGEQGILVTVIKTLKKAWNFLKKKKLKKERRKVFVFVILLDWCNIRWYWSDCWGEWNLEGLRGWNHYHGLLQYGQSNVKITFPNFLACVNLNFCLEHCLFHMLWLFNSMVWMS